MRYHIHGIATLHQYKAQPVSGSVTVSVDADGSHEAIRKAKLLCPHLDVIEIEVAA